MTTSDPYAGGAHAAEPAGDDLPRVTTAESTQEASLGDLLSHLMSDVTALFRQEVELAKAELREEGSRAAKAMALVAGAAGVALLAAILLSFALAWLLAEFLPTWIGFLIVGAIYAVVAAVLAKNGQKKLQQVKPVPEQTVETLKEDAQWAKDRGANQ